MFNMSFPRGTRDFQAMEREAFEVVYTQQSLSGCLQLVTS